MEFLETRGITHSLAGPYIATDFCREVKKLNVGHHDLAPDVQASLLVAGQCDCGRAMAKEPQTTIVMDRGWISSLVYQGLAPGDDDATRLLIDGAMHYGRKYPTPRVVVFLDIAPDTAYQRLLADKNPRLNERFKSRGVEWLQKLKAGYTSIMAAPWDGMSTSSPETNSSVFNARILFRLGWEDRIELRRTLLGDRLISINAEQPAEMVHSTVLAALAKELGLHVTV